MDVTKTFEEILNYLHDWKLPVCNFLNDGEDESTIEEAFKSIELTAPSELIALYKQTNGTDIRPGTILGNLYFFPGYHFLSLKDAISSYLAMKGDNRWNENWFPVFSNGGGDFYAIDLSASDGISAPVIGFLLGETDHEIEYQSLTSMLLTFLICYEKNIIFKTSEGFLEMDYDKHSEIAREYNPNVNLWQNQC